MSKTYSITEARNDLATLVHELARYPQIELIQRGQRVAVLLSAHEYERLQHTRTGFWDAYTHFCATVELPRIPIEPSVFQGLRDSSPGREVSW